MASWTIRRAEKINGLQYVVVEHEKSFEVSAWEGQTLVAIDHDKDLEEAVRLVVESVYRRNKHVMFEKYDWRCSRCGERTGLDAHHVVPRSKGRNDRISNLIPYCRSCHDKHHHGHT
jgi:5-methylcytosine-specific restriction endonuclease McrA